MGRGKHADHRPHPYRRGGPSGGRGRQEQPYEEEEYTTREYYDKGIEVYPRGRAQREEQGYSRGAQYPSRAREVSLYGRVSDSLINLCVKILFTIVQFMFIIVQFLFITEQVALLPHRLVHP